MGVFPISYIAPICELIVSKSSFFFFFSRIQIKTTKPGKQQLAKTIEDQMSPQIFNSHF